MFCSLVACNAAGATPKLPWIQGCRSETRSACRGRLSLLAFLLAKHHRSLLCLQSAEHHVQTRVKARTLMECKEVSGTEVCYTAAKLEHPRAPRVQRGSDDHWWATAHNQEQTPAFYGISAS
jgi:hypothetical protein